MSVWLNVAEKPSVAKEIARVLSACGGESPRSVPSTSRYNPVFEFRFDGKTMLVTSVAGHLMELEFPPETKGWATYPFEQLFTAKINKTVSGKLQPVERNLEALSRRAQTLVLWLDCDREGENICFEVMQVARRQNSRLAIKRAHFSALTQRDLLHAVRNLREPDQRLSEAVEARQEMDLRIGAVFTRFQSVRFGSAFRGIPRMLSFGPCQFPTLGFVVERHWERQGFVPEDMYTIHVAHDATRFHSSRGPMYDPVGAALVFEDMLEAAAQVGHAGVITRVHQRPSRKRPPVPLATVVMQKLAATHLRLPSERCMALAEQLYQEGLISYPRTETDSFTFNDGELLELAKVQTANPVVGDFAAAMVADPQHRFRRPLRGGHDDKAHPPIHPTKAWAQGGGSDEKAKLYTLIVRHFLACLSPDAIAATTSVTADYGGEALTTSGTTVAERGYLDVYPYENWNSSCIPNYKEGDAFQPTEVNLDKTRTAPPPNLSETDLISLMDDHGIGTDATIAQHIKTVLEREYVRREGQTLVPTKLGVALAAAYEALGLTSLLQPQLRAQMETAMGDIAAGRATREQVVAAAVQLYREIFQRLEANGSTFHRELGKYLEVGGDGGDGGGPASRPEAVPLSELKVSKKRFTNCGACGKPMELSYAPKQAEGAWEHWFVHCSSGGGGCGALLRIPSGHLNILEDTQQRCALCSHTALRVTNREKQTSHTLCPHCYNNPPALADIESAPAGGGGFRCFQCTADCPLAKGLEQLSITNCVSCGSNSLRLRSGAGGRSFLSCKGYPDCAFAVSLPAATRITPAPERRCGRCQSVLLLFDFTAVQGVPGMDAVEAACVTCDERLRDYISVRGYKGPTAAPAPTDSGAGGGGGGGYVLPAITATGGGGSGGGSGGGGGDVKCGCGTAAKRLVSRKETSMGRAFFTCPSRKCNFFMWAD